MFHFFIGEKYLVWHDVIRYFFPCVYIWWDVKALLLVWNLHKCGLSPRHILNSSAHGDAAQMEICKWAEQKLSSISIACQSNYPVRFLMETYTRQWSQIHPAYFIAPVLGHSFGRTVDIWILFDESSITTKLTDYTTFVSNSHFVGSILSSLEIRKSVVTLITCIKK